MVAVGGLSVAVKAAATVKDLVVAHRFGTHDALDAFLIAFTLPTFAITVVGNSFNAALVPTLIEARELRGQEAAQRLFSNVAFIGCGLLLGVALLLGLLAPVLLPLLGARFTPEKLALTRSLYLLLLPLVFINGLSTIWGAVLNAGERFALPSVTPVLVSAFAVASLLLFGDSRGVHALAAGTVAGSVAESLLLGRALRRQGFSILPRWTGADALTRRVVWLYLPMIAGALLMSGTTVVDQAVATRLGPGSVSTLSYGTKLVTAALGVGSLSLSTAVLPHFSRMVAVADWAGVRHTMRTYTRLILLVTIPAVILGVALSRPIVALLFERGAFTAADSTMVARVQALSLLQVPMYALSILGVRLIAAMSQQRLLMWIAALNLVVNIAGDLLLMRWLGVSGIALSATVVYACSSAVVFTTIRVQLRGRSSVGRAG